MSTGNIEGYLFQIDDNTVRIVFCILDEGLMQYFSYRGGELLGVIALSNCKVNVALLPQERNVTIRNRFVIESQPHVIRNFHNSKKSDAEKKATHSQQHVKTRRIFAGSTQEITDAWAVALLNWNRYTWDDPMTLSSSKNEYEKLLQILESSKENSMKQIMPAPFIRIHPAILPL